MMDNNATIRILLDQSDGVIRAQGWLKGHVEVEPKAHLPAGQVVVQLVGKESVCSYSHNTQSEQVVFDEQNIHNILDTEFLEPGREYKFPFSIYLPGSIPPSMMYKDKVHLEGCGVKYHLIAKFAECEYQQELAVVGAPLSTKIYPAEVGPNSLSVLKASSKSSWIPVLNSTGTNAGSVLLSARVENSHVGKGRDVKFAVALRNRSSLNVESVQANLVERIDWKVGEHISPRRDTAVLASVDCSEIPTLNFSKSSAPDVADKDPLKVDDKALSTEMHAEMTSPRSSLELKVPLAARDSYKGKLIHVSHHLVITVKSEGSDNQTHIEIPMEVFDPPVESLSHSLVASPDSPLVAPTVWPDESLVVPLSPSHQHRKTESRHSCLSISEDEPLAEVMNE